MLLTAKNPNPESALVSNLAVVKIPNNIQEAWENPDWRKAIRDEMHALEKIGTWEVVPKPKEKVPVGCKWVFTIKYKGDGSIERYKARLVAKGYTQTYDIDYQETFAPVAKMNTVHVLLSLATNLEWPLQKLDQSPRVWFGRFAKAIRRQDYKQAQTDHTLFYRRKNGKITILIVYVDDIILTGDDVIDMERLKQKLATEFEMKDLGSLRYFLVETPVDSNVKIDTQKVNNPIDSGRYQHLVGKLIYLSYTRPDIAFAVSWVSQIMHAPAEEHMVAVYRILKYLKGTLGRGLFFGKNGEGSIEAYIDVDWAGAIDDRKSTSGYCTFVWGNLVTWRSKKQTVIARSIAKVESRSVAHGICEVLWLQIFLEELEVAAWDANLVTPHKRMGNAAISLECLCDGENPLNHIHGHKCL
ncbi:Retrovirus-related Pol polyprotein from transposon RE1 [Vitis vinifera]|uniref:Retrovirus-related Pol polyprotein from transposon RE1 n=1 Tax=Vitis vinifera TaxID=29760 RepID=A0A438IJE2_VITVI|nr:Retrovirus-related Pol polyprotein from transposon RE1 [Vitis vinifera]